VFRLLCRRRCRLLAGPQSDRSGTSEAPPPDPVPAVTAPDPAPAVLEAVSFFTGARSRLAQIAIRFTGAGSPARLEGESLYDLGNAFTLAAQAFLVAERRRIETGMSQFLRDGDDKI
jgi:hypothetical protein